MHFGFQAELSRPGGNTRLPYMMIVTRIIKAMGVDSLGKAEAQIKHASHEGPAMSESIRSQVTYTSAANLREVCPPDMTSLQAQIYLIQKEGVKSFNLVLKQVEYDVPRV
ncbi:hypothetical protein HAX54_000444 [Datura stramonium]|uniref:Uncharacterized protein n=1 Tax=Datura stramonium TaxID=4076 RepID=A0ABS8WS03_DATST|nr:hypothetical protein [Datura stramonium]